MSRNPLSPISAEWDAAVGRVSSEIDVSGTWDQVRNRLQNKHPKWTQKQLDAFTRSIIEKQAFVEGQTRADVKKRIIARQTTVIFSRTKTKKTIATEIIRDKKGRFIGKPENIKIYYRAGVLRYKNIKTGKKGIL